MSQNQESTLLVTMIVTLCIIGGVAWLFFKRVTPQNPTPITLATTSSTPITRSLFVIVKENGQIAQEAGEAYSNLLLSEQGQQLISKTGFVRIK